MFEKFIKKLREDKFLTLETTPAHSPTFDPIIDKIESLGLYEKVDGFSATDNPLAKLKYSSIIASFKLQQRFKKPVLATMSMRDRNKLALQSDLLGANDIDVRAILALTGDPASASDQPKTKGVFEGNSNLLLDIIKCFNAGIDYAGKPFFEKPKKIYPFAVSNAYSKNSKNILKKLIQKIEHGAFGIVTQPVYDLDNAKLLIDLFEQAKKEATVKNNDPVLILGFFPVTKLRTAQFLTSHVPGVYVPKMWVDKLYKAKKISEEEQEKVGFDLSLETFLKLYEFYPKMHLMTANNFSLAKRLLDEL
ncbi:MAG: methylenetetrahydrofolate reductase [Epsilonproteobacteria bacterium]|nr:methylenetetrahydrofolate reductase [Campylobacterota bacterium]